LRPADCDAPINAKHNWCPLELNEIQRLFADLRAPWRVAGGWAIELAVGQAVREHDDVDILVLRRDQEHVRAVLGDWDIVVADPTPGNNTLRSWGSNEIIRSPLNCLWCRRRVDQPWSLEVLLDEADGDTWVSRREPRIRRPVASLGWRTAAGLPVLVPEIQLFYKSKNTRSKDNDDFEAVLPHLKPEQREWLDGALAISNPEHSWRLQL